LEKKKESSLRIVTSSKTNERLSILYKGEGENEKKTGSSKGKGEGNVDGNEVGKSIIVLSQEVQGH